MPILPEVEQAKGKVALKEKLMWTVVVLVVYLGCNQIPLYGLPLYSTDGSDPFYWMRKLMASNRGSLMELGISPIVTSGLIMQLLVGAKLIEVNQADKDERTLYAGSQKLLGIVITIVEAVAYVLSGMYGDISVIGPINALLIIVQLIVAGLIVLCLDEMLQKGYGFGSGISLFIATNICETIVWQALSPNQYSGPAGPEYEGALISLLAAVTREDKIGALQQAFFRSDAPNVTNLLATVFVFLLVVFFQGFAVSIPVKHQKAGSGMTQSKQIRLFYTSNMPIILLSALISNVYFISQLMYKKFPNNMIVSLLGVWQAPEASASAQMRPVGGLAYFMSAPTSLSAAAMDPLHALIYVAFMLAACALLSRTWIEVSGSSAYEQAKQMKEQEVFMPGFRNDVKTMKRHLDRYVTTAASFGGFCIGALTIVADLLGAVGSGTGILLAVTTIYEYYEQIKQEAPGELSVASIMK